MKDMEAMMQDGSRPMMAGGTDGMMGPGMGMMGGGMMGQGTASTLPCASMAYSSPDSPQSLLGQGTAARLVQLEELSRKTKSR